MPENPKYAEILHPTVAGYLEGLQISDLYPPQWEAIRKGVGGGNLVVSIPTASGKTLIAEILALHRRFSGAKQSPPLKVGLKTKKTGASKGKILYLCPLKALANEKFKEFRTNWKPLGLKVGISISDVDQPDYSVFKNDLIILTNEKADSLLRNNPALLDQVETVICDEIHLINDETRGITLEFLLTQILQRTYIQIIGLSATIKNAADLAHWLNADLVLSDWRPVQLKEGYFLKGYIYFSDDTCRLVQDIPSKTPLDTLVVDILKEGGQALVFTNSRRSAVSMAESLRTPVRLTASKPDQQAMKENHEIYLKEAADDTDISKKLADCLAHGVAFHHAGLPNAQLDFIVQQYNMKIIKVICCTPTLAAGVNTPARRVIISSLYRYSAEKGNQPISIMEYKQMAGRAGRPRYDPYGEVVILGSNPERLQEDAARFMHGEPEAITSKLDDEVQLQGHILGLIAAKIAQTSDSIYELLLKTFYVHQLSKKQPKPSLPKKSFGRNFTSTSLRPKPRRSSGRGADPLGLESDDRMGFKSADSIYEESRELKQEEEFEFDIIRGERIRKEMKYKLRGILEYFVEKELIQQDETKTIYTATKFGLITNQLYIPPRDAVKIREDLEYAAVLDSKEEISLNDVSFLHLLSSLASFPKPYMRTKDAAIVIPFVDDQTDHYIVEEVPEPGAYLFDQFAQENKLVMILSQWIDEAPDKEIVENFDIGAGDLHRFVENAQWLMRAVVQIDRLKVTSKFSQLLEILYLRIVHGVRPQLIPLIRLRGIGRIRARKLYHEGFTTLEKIAAASPDALERVPLIGKELAAQMQDQIRHPETLGKKKGKSLKPIVPVEAFPTEKTKQSPDNENPNALGDELKSSKRKPSHSLDKYFK